MELWQMDVVGGVALVDGSEAKVVTGVDDHSRLCVSALVAARASTRPTCDALALAMRRHGASCTERRHRHRKGIFVGALEREKVTLDAAT